MKYLFVKLIVNSLQRLSHVQLNVDILFVKFQIKYCTNRVLHLKNTLYILCFRGWGFHTMPAVFIYNILQVASITELF